MRKALALSLTLISLGAVIDTAAAKPHPMGIGRYVASKADIQRLCPAAGGVYALDHTGGYSCNIPAFNGLPTVAIDCAANGHCTETLGASLPAGVHRAKQALQS